jgi:hypothetical protein
MPFDKILIFLAVIVAGILQIVAYKHYISDGAIIYLTAGLYLIQIAVCFKYIIDGKFSFYSLLVLLIMGGIIGEYLDFIQWPAAKFLKSTWAIAYIIFSILLFRKAFNNQKYLDFFDRLTIPITATILLFQAISIIVGILSVEYFFTHRELYLAIILLGNTMNYAIIALMLTILFNNKYRIIMLPGETRIITLIALISCLPIIENFFHEFLSSF